jgi:GNAT superfamily N-acetyltransferase
VSELPAFTVRRATADDIPALVELRIAFDRELAGEVPIELAAEHRARIEAYLRSHVPDGRFRVWVADAAGHVVGMAGLVVIDRPPHQRSRRAPEAMVFNVMTLPAWRGRPGARLPTPRAPHERRRKPPVRRAGIRRPRQVAAARPRLIVRASRAGRASGSA